MATSQNGYSANDRSVIGTYSIPGGNITIRQGDVSVVLLYVAFRFHNEVEGLIWPGNWGYAERAIRGATQLSNHASGTAIDLNAPRHPLGTSPSANFSGAQINKIHEIVGFTEGVVRWGGDYTGRKDGMHFEINAGSAAVTRIANKIRAAGGIPGGGGGASTGGGTGASADVKWIQQRLTYWGFPLTADGISGPKTKEAIKAFQAAHGLEADGLVGPKTRAALTANKPGDTGGGTAGNYKPIPLGGVSSLYTSGEQVRKDQADLNDTGFKVTADGYWGPGTVVVAKKFQAAAGLTQDGAFGPASRTAIHKVPSYGGLTARQWQQALKNRGWNITVDGVWGARSASILKQFQAEKGLVADGLRGPASWTALFTRPK